jgi:hypothetical protein
MALYTNQTGKLKEVKEKPFKLEKDIQKVFEENLSAIMGLKLKLTTSRHICSKQFVLYAVILICSFFVILNSYQ